MPSVAPRQTPAVPFRVRVMLVGSRWRPTETAEQRRLAGWWRRQRTSDLSDHVADGADDTSRGTSTAGASPLASPRPARTVQPRIVRDDLMWVDAGSPQLL